MSFNVVFFLMAAILGTLIIFSKFFRGHEKQKMKLEVKYFESLQEFKIGGLNREALIKEGTIYFTNQGLSQKESKERVEKDLTLLQSLI